MKTTKQDAIAFYNITKYIDPFNVFTLDKQETIKELMKTSFEENFELLQDLICEVYDDTRTFIEDEESMRLYLNICKRRKRNV